MAIGSVWAEVPVVKGSDDYGRGADYITAKVNTEQNEALQSRDIFLLNKFKEYYDKNHIDNLFSKYTTNLDWKETLETYDDILAKYPTGVDWHDTVATYSDLFTLAPEDEWVVNVKDVQDKYYFVYFIDEETGEGTWEQVDLSKYSNNVVEELSIYPYIYYNGYWQELVIDNFSELEQSRFLNKESVRSYNEIETKYPEPEEYWVVNVVDPNHDFLLKGEVEYYEDISTTYPNPDDHWLVEVINDPENNCTYKYSEAENKWLRFGEKFKPEDGWVVNVMDTNYTYRYDEPSDTWIAISANAIPLANEEVDGLLSSKDYSFIRSLGLEDVLNALGFVNENGDIIDLQGVLNANILPNLYLSIRQIEEKMLPLGTIVPYAFNTTEPPAGFVFAEGGLYRRDEYPEMWEKLYKEGEYNYTVEDSIRDQYPGKFTDGDGETTFRVPDLRGIFIRGWDPEGIYEKYSRSFGSYQSDAVSEHSHEIEVTGVGSVDEPVIENHTLTIAGTTPNQFAERALINLYASSDAETRPKNTALRFIVKIVPSEKLPTVSTSTDPIPVERPLDADTLNGHPSALSPAPGVVPVANANGKLDNEWFNIDDALMEEYVKESEVSRMASRRDTNMIPVTNDAGNLDSWLTTVTIEDIDRYILYLNSDTFDISTVEKYSSFNDDELIERHFITDRKFVKFLIALREYIRTFKHTYTTEEVEPTNERGYISNAERIKYSDKYTKNETYELLYNFLRSYIPLADATTVPTEGKIPIAGEGGKLDPGWMNDLFLNKIGTDDDSGYAEVSGSKDIHIRAGIVDNTLTGNVNIQGGGAYSTSDISPAKAVISGYDTASNKGGDITLSAGTGGTENVLTVGGSITLESGYGTAYDGTVNLNNIKVNRNNTIYTESMNLRLQRNDNMNNSPYLTSYIELTNTSVSYIHDNLVNDSDDYEFTLHSDGSVTTNKPNVNNGITLLNGKALVPFNNLPKTVVVNNIGDILSDQTINTQLGNVIVANIGQNTNLTIEDSTDTDEARELTFILTIRGLYNVNWPLNVNWLSGNKPELNYGETAIIKLFRIAGGEWLGWKVGDAVNVDDVSREISIDHYEAPLDEFNGVLHKYIQETHWEPGQEPDKENLNITVTVNDVVATENATITIRTPYDAYGNINVTVNNTDTNTEVFNETIRLIDTVNTVVLNSLSIGNYEVIVEYPGNELYNETTTTTTFTVAKLDTTITIIAPNTAIVGDTLTVTASVAEDATGRLKINMQDENEQSSNMTNNRIQENGTVTTTVRAQYTGINTITVTYTGDDKYNSAYAEQEVTVLSDQPDEPIIKQDPNLSVSAIDRVVGDSAIIEAILDIPTGSEANGTVEITISDESNNTYNYTVDISGDRGTLVVPDLPVGIYTVTANYSGDDTYSSDSATITFTIESDKDDPEMSVSSSYIDVEENEYIAITLPNDATGTLSLYIPENSETVTEIKNVENSTTNFNIPNLQAGNYTFRVYYSGDITYDSDSYSGSFTVSQESGN